MAPACSSHKKRLFGERLRGVAAFLKSSDATVLGCRDGGATVKVGPLYRSL